MRIAFRADASLAIGTGHIMRCLTLADALRESGGESVFLSRDHNGHMHHLVQSRGYSLLSLGGVNEAPSSPSDNPYFDWVGVEPQRDAEEARIRLEDQPVDWLVVDHYGLDAAWEHMLRPVCANIMALDDLANRNHAVDVLLDQNLGKTKADYETRLPKSCSLLLGPRYALIRPEFAALRAESLSRRSKGLLRKLLITMGGVDLDNATGAVLEALNKWGPSADLEVTVVMGPRAPWRDQVIHDAQNLSFPTKVLVNVRTMGNLMCDSDLAIGAAGSTSWEFCCLGLPALQLVLADNQHSISNALSKAGAIHQLSRQGLVTSLASIMDQLIRDPALLLRMSSAAATVIDGLGAQRVARYIMKRPQN